MGIFNVNAKNTMLDAIVPVLMKLHDGDPGANGTANDYVGGSYADKACVFDAAAASSRALNADVLFDGVATESVTWASVWTAAGAAHMGNINLTGDTAFNASGEITVTAAGTSLDITDS